VIYNFLSEVLPAFPHAPPFGLSHQPCLGGVALSRMMTYINNSRQSAVPISSALYSQASFAWVAMSRDGSLSSCRCHERNI